MRDEPNIRIEQYRKEHPTMGQSPAGTSWGYFEVGSLRIISSGSCDDNPHAKGWEHVSVSHADRCPTWDEMCRVKELFWRDDETVVQFHPRKSEYMNKHPNCLHLWKQADSEYVLPPREFVA